MTCEPFPPSTLRQTELPLMSSAADFPAKTSVSPGKAPDLQASVPACGVNTPVLLASYDRNTSSWKTSQLCLDGDLETFSETWPRSGMMRSGTAYQLQPLAPLIDETASGLWPTPTVNGNYNRRGASATSGDGLATAVKMWPTPAARDYRSPSKKVGTPEYFRRPGSGLPLNDAVGGQLNPTWVEWLMGFPAEWTALPPSVTPSSRKSRN